MGSFRPFSPNSRDLKNLDMTKNKAPDFFYQYLFQWFVKKEGLESEDPLTQHEMFQGELQEKLGISLDTYSDYTIQSGSCVEINMGGTYSLPEMWRKPLSLNLGPKNHDSTFLIPCIHATVLNLNQEELTSQECQVKLQCGHLYHCDIKASVDLLLICTKISMHGNYHNPEGKIVLTTSSQCGSALIEAKEITLNGCFDYPKIQGVLNNSHCKISNPFVYETDNSLAIGEDNTIRLICLPEDFKLVISGEYNAIIIEADESVLNSIEISYVSPDLEAKNTILFL